MLRTGDGDRDSDIGLPEETEHAGWNMVGDNKQGTVGACAVPVATELKRNSEIERCRWPSAKNIMRNLKSEGKQGERPKKSNGTSQCMNIELMVAS